MNQEIKQKWIDALRSGDYKQTNGRLRQDDKFCCLGVLCNILFPNYWRFTQSGWTHGACEYVLPSEVIEAAELSDNNPTITGYSMPDEDDSSLAWYNDAGMTFEQIAEMIEKNL